jgi:hypothetical protein
VKKINEGKMAFKMMENISTEPGLKVFINLEKKKTFQLFVQKSETKCFAKTEQKWKK